QGLCADLAWSSFQVPKMGVVESAASPKAPKCSNKSAIANVTRTSPARKYLCIRLSFSERILWRKHYTTTRGELLKEGIVGNRSAPQKAGFWKDEYLV